jgi:hypothetical protein
MIPRRIVFTVFLQESTAVKYVIPLDYQYLLQLDDVLPTNIPGKQLASSAEA